MKDYYLQLININKSYQQNNEKMIVLQDIDFYINQGEFVVILGPSGCGKSTLLKIVAGFLEAEKGFVYQRGEKISGSSSDRIMVFQEFRQLLPWKTVLGNVLFALKAKNIGEALSQRDEIARCFLDKVGLSDVYDYYPHQLSGGMKQRAALARALAADPELMLMDEPFGSLDSQTRSTLQNLLIDIWQEARKTILFVTHDINEAIILADRIVIMDKNPGRVKDIISNDQTRPRNILDDDFAHLYDTISDHLYNR